MVDTTGRIDATDRIEFLPLDDERAVDADLTGGKAAALARATMQGLATLPGVVLTTAFCEQIDEGSDVDGHPAVQRAFEHASGSSSRLVARSSSVVEDTGESSQAGQFESVIGIDGLEALTDAVREVLDSRERAGATEEPIAVLVQPFIEPSVGGVLFGVDPVSGRSDRVAVSAVGGQPEPLVSGEIEGSRYVLDADGSIVQFDLADGVELPDARLTELVRLGARVTEVFGEPQDVEWAVVDDELLLLQSRPVTTEIRGVPQGPVYGPGPVAETFPEPLATLERDLWIPPLNDGIAEALRLAATVSDHDLDGDDLVVLVDGYAAIDLERTGDIETDRKRSGRLGLRRRIRRLRSAWRVGRLRSALPALADRLARRVDDDLESLPRLDAMTDRQVVALLGRSREALRSLHAHEVLMGLLTDASQIRLTGASVAMRVLTEARHDGRPDAEIVAQSPVVLALTAPKITGGVELPDEARTPDLPPAPGGGREEAGTETGASIQREALRLRVRWVQELTGRAAWELGERLHRAGRMASPEQVRWVTLEDLIALVTRRSEVVDDVLSHHIEDRPQPAPLPARFRISDRGRPVPYRLDDGAGGGTGAGGGRRTGVVSHDVDDPPAGSVLVVTSLMPGIGPLLTRLHGVVAETGSVLAHLAILAREADVPTVVGYTSATEEFEEGQTVEVDGDSGEVRVVRGEPTGHDDNEEGGS